MSETSQVQKPKVERIPSGIEGLDQLIEGGFPKKSAILVSGNAGTGKTIFLSQYLWKGLQLGDNCLFVTLEETPEEIKDDAILFGWDFSKYESTGQFRIEYFDPFELGDLATRLEDMIRVNNYTRVAIDSTALFGMYINDLYKIRKTLFKLIEGVKKTDATILMSTEIPEGSNQLSRFGVEEFVCDGVIVLYYTGLGEGVFRNIEIRKMRRTNHKNGTFPMEITDRGIVVKMNTLL